MGDWRTTMLMAAVAALAAQGCSAGAKEPAVPAGSAQVLCMNTTSGAAWTVAVDEARSRVDGLAARIDRKRISWRDPADAASYELDRGSGRLIVIRPSSTGGYMMFDRCRAKR